jgi:DNA-binding CsgD family transcriptional regulator/PAS domain-containing protein
MRAGSIRGSQNRGDQLLLLVDQIYAAATDPAEWPSFFINLSRATGSAFSGLALHDLESHWGAAMWYGGVDASVVAGYQQWAPKNIYMIAAADSLRSGVALNGADLLREREVLESEFFNDFLRRIGVKHNIGACVFKEQTLSAMLMLPRPLNKAPHSAEDLKLVSRLVPHLQRAVSIYRRLGGLDIERAALSDALDHFTRGVLFLDEKGRVILFNRSAGAILAQGDGVSLVRDGLVASRVDETKALRRLVANACATGACRGTHAGGAMLVSRPSGRRALSVLVAPLRLRQFPLASPVPAAVVFVSDPEQAVEGVEPFLQRLYGLTATEGAVATLLLEGRRLEEIGERLSISWNTVRTHVKRILAKADVRTQAEFIRVVLLGPAGLNVPVT